MEISIWYFHLFCQILGLQNVMDMHNFCKISVYKIGKFDRIVNICYQKLSSCSSPSSSLFYLYVLTLFDFFLYSDFFSILIIWVNFSFPPVAAVSKCRSSHCSAGHPGLENYFLILKYFSPFFPRFISSLPIFCILLSLAGNCRH